MPKVTPSLVKQQELLSIIKDKEPVPMAFFNKRSESIIVPAATKFTWKLHLSGGIERPRGSYCIPDRKRRRSNYK